MNNLIEPSTISANKVELTELAKDSVLPTGIRFNDLFILSDVFSLLSCPICLITNILKLLDIEDKKKGLARFMQSKCRDCESKHSFNTAPQIDSPKDNRCRGKRTVEIKVRAV